jgi:hypothetical protein
VSTQTKKNDGTWKLVCIAALVGLGGMLLLELVTQRQAYKASADWQISAPLPATASAPRSSK